MIGGCVGTYVPTMGLKGAKVEPPLLSLTGSWFGAYAAAITDPQQLYQYGEFHSLNSTSRCARRAALSAPMDISGPAARIKFRNGTIASKIW